MTAPERNSAIIFFRDSMDSFFRYFRHIKYKPISLQLGIGAGVGFYVFTKTSRLFAIFIGCSIILLQFFNHRGYLKFNRPQIQQDFDDIKNILKKEIGIEKSALPSGREIDDFVTKNVYLLSGFMGGSLIGYGFS